MRCGALSHEISHEISHESVYVSSMRPAVDEAVCLAVDETGTGAVRGKGRCGDGRLPALRSRAKDRHHPVARRALDSYTTRGSRIAAIVAG